MNTTASRGSNKRFLHFFTRSILVFLVFCLLPVQAFADSCNPSLSINVLGEPFFLNDPVTISADLGAGNIEGGTKLTIDKFQFGLDCGPLDLFPSCVSPGNGVSFNAASITTNCTGPGGVPITLNTAGTNVIVFTPSLPIENAANSTCNVQFSVSVSSLTAGTQINEQMGWLPQDARCDNENPLPSSSNAALAFSVFDPSIAIEKDTNGDDSDTAPGESIVIGAPVSWNYVVSNTGNTALSNVVVSDDQGVTVTCPRNTLTVAPDGDATMTCTASGVATAGQYTNVGSVSGTFLTATVADTDPSNYLGVTPSIVLIKEISIDGGANYLDANDVGNAPITRPPSDALYRITVRNTGNTDLINVNVSDDSIAFSWPFTVPGGLAAGASFEINSGVIPALSVSEACTRAGLFTNIASVTADTVAEPSAQVTDEDQANLICVDVDIAIPVNQPLALLLLILSISTMAAIVIRRSI